MGGAGWGMGAEFKRMDGLGEGEGEGEGESTGRDVKGNEFEGSAGVEDGGGMAAGGAGVLGRLE